MRKWTEDMLREEASKYQTRGAFKLGSNSAYQAAIYRGLLESICGHMEVLFASYTEESLRLEALKYQTRSAFVLGSNGAYQTAKRRGLLDSICGHMNRLTKASDNDAIYIWQADGMVGKDGYPVYKIGLTSYRLGNSRISICAKRHNFNPIIIRIAQVSDALDLEDKLLAIGSKVPEIYQIKIQGYSEFRELTNGQLEKVLAMIADHEVSECALAA